MYNVNYTDKNKNPIDINDGQTDNTSSVTLYGRKTLSYGQGLQEDLLHILENFASYEDANNPGNPDKSKAITGVFDNLIEGQAWFNKTNNSFYYYNGSEWVRVSNQDEYAVNWGVISDGEQLPKPISFDTGLSFDYSNCVWIVSPNSFPERIDYMVCDTDSIATVNFKYRIYGTNSIVGGFANYIIIGITGNQNGTTPTVSIALSPTPTPTPTSSVGTSPTPTPTVTRSITPSPTSTPVASSTPAASPTSTPAPTRTPTPTPTRSHTPNPTPSSTPVASVTPTPSPTRSMAAVQGCTTCPPGTVADGPGCYNPNTGQYSACP